MMATTHRRHVPAAAVLIAACLGARTGALAQGKLFKSSVETVPLYVTVTDQQGQPIRDLVEADFQVEDNGKRQAITVFKNDVQPVTTAILLDGSPSLFPSAARAADFVNEFMRHMIVGDRACVGTFNQTVSLNPALKEHAADLIAGLRPSTPWPAGTAIWDAIDAGRAVVEPEGGKRVVLIITDGADNASRVDPNVVRTALQRERIMLYGIAIRGRMGLDTTEIGALANSTGGRLVELKSSDDVAATARLIADELHNQYVIGFTPPALDDKMHRVNVRVRRPGATVRTTRLYYAARGDAK